jgi:DNA-binding MarR family transcriptional regulator
MSATGKASGSADGERGASAERAAPAERSTPEEGLEARLVGTIGPVFRHLLAHARRRPAWQEMTYQQYNVLRIVQQHGTTGQAEIARRLLVSAPVVTRLAAALVDAGLLERREDPADKRAVLLALTATGRRQTTAMRRELLDAAGELLEPIPPEQREAVAEALERLQVLLPDGPATR